MDNTELERVIDWARKLPEPDPEVVALVEREEKQASLVSDVLDTMRAWDKIVEAQARQVRHQKLLAVIVFDVLLTAIAGMCYLFFQLHSIHIHHVHFPPIPIRP